MSNQNFDNIIASYKSRNNYNSSRYSKLARIEDDNGDKYIESYESINFPKRSDDHYHIVEAKDENRLDLIAYQYYGNSLLYWVIAEASEISDPLDVPVGTILRIPSKTSLYGYQGVLV